MAAYGSVMAMSENFRSSESLPGQGWGVEYLNWPTLFEQITSEGQDITGGWVTAQRTTNPTWVAALEPAWRCWAQSDDNEINLDGRWSQDCGAVVDRRDNLGLCNEHRLALCRLEIDGAIMSDKA